VHIAICEEALLHEKSMSLTQMCLYTIPTAFFKFKDNHIVISLVVIEKLDNLKKGHGDIVYSARHALKLIDYLRERGNVAAGVKLDTGGTFNIESIADLSENLSPDKRSPTIAFKNAYAI
jgi:predicted ribonuclease YlaK